MQETDPVWLDVPGICARMDLAACRSLRLPVGECSSPVTPEHQSRLGPGHRPLTMALSQMYVYGADVHVSTNDPVSRATLVAHLVRSPEFSLVDAMQRTTEARDAYLTESATVTLDRAQRRVIALAEVISTRCGEHWADRRASSAVQMNHAAQWKRTEPGPRFAGFAPDTVPIEASFLMLNPTTADRMFAAHLDDTRRAGTWGAEN